MSGWSETVAAPVVVIAGCISSDAVKRWRDFWPKARYHLFEPLPEYAANLRTTFAGDALVTINEMALADMPGRVPFHVMAIPYASSILPFNEEHEAVKPWWTELEAIEVGTTTLDAYCEQHSIGRIGFMELDVQGAELEALHGAAGLLYRKAIDALMVEVFYSDVYQGVPVEPTVSNYLAGYGYKAVEKSMAQPDVWGDVIYVRGQA